MSFNVKLFSETYQLYLKDYVYRGGDEEVLMRAYESLMQLIDPFTIEITTILDVHINATSAIFQIQHDNDLVQWVYVQRTNEFFAQVIMALDSYMMNLREEIENDTLTGLRNRVAMGRIIPSIWLECQKAYKQVVLCVIDVDNFKNVNDTFGHAVGDSVLKAVADSIKSGRRKTDLVFRYGGEEFIIVFQELSYNEALNVLERIRRGVEELEIGENQIKVTISIGAASYIDDKPASIDDFIKFADMAMYEAKKFGKNRVVLFKDIKEQILM